MRGSYLGSGRSETTGSSCNSGSGDLGYAVLNLIRLRCQVPPRLVARQHDVIALYKRPVRLGPSGHTPLSGCQLPKKGEGGGWAPGYRERAKFASWDTVFGVRSGS